MHFVNNKQQLQSFYKSFFIESQLLEIKQNVRNFLHNFKVLWQYYTMLDGIPSSCSYWKP